MSAPRAGSTKAAGDVPVTLSMIRDPRYRPARTLGIAAADPANDRNVHAAEIADRRALRGQRSENADQEGTFLLAVHDRLHIRLVDDGVDDDEPRLRESFGHAIDRGALIKADSDHDGCPAPDQGRQRLDALAVVGALGLAIGDAGFRLEPLGADVSGLVEGFVELGTLRIDDPRCRVVPGGGEAANANRSVGQRRCRNSLISGKIRGKVRKMIGFDRNIIS
jgi:hypothetical protein